MVTDYHETFNDEELNIVQRDTCTIYDEKEFMLGNVFFWISSATNFKAWLHADRIELAFKWIKFKQEYLRVAKVKALGLTECFYRKDKKRYEFNSVECECNPVMEKILGNNNFESICYLLDRYFKDEKSLLSDTRKFIVTKRELDVLFKNFIGC